MRLSLAITAMLLFLSASVAHGQTPASCPKAALVDGPPALVAELRLHLDELGVAGERRPGCSAVRVALESSSGGLVLSLQEDAGRSSYRRFQHLRTAAAWIDSWLHQDLGSPLLAARLPPAPTPAVAGPAETTGAAPAVSAILSPSPSAPSKYPSLQASLAYESAQSNGQSWQSLRAGACMELAGTCTGADLRIARAADPISAEGGLASFEQDSIDAMLTMSVPWRIARATLSPRGAVGMTRISTRANMPDLCLPAPDGADCQPIELEGRRASWTPLVELGVDLALPVSSWLDLYLGASVDLRPVRGLDKGDGTDGAEPLPDCGPDDPSCQDPPPAPLIIPTPEQHRRFLRFTLGLRVPL